MPDKIPTIHESALTNANSRTVLTSYLAPGSTTFPHYHTRFSESFTLLSSSSSPRSIIGSLARPGVDDDSDGGSDKQGSINVNVNVNVNVDAHTHTHVNADPWNTRSLTVWKCAEPGDWTESNMRPYVLRNVGDKVTVERGTLHTFEVSGGRGGAGGGDRGGDHDRKGGDKEDDDDDDDGGVQCQVRFEPGSVGFEKTVLIMRGVQRDGEYRVFSGGRETTTIGKDEGLGKEEGGEDVDVDVDVDVGKEKEKETEGIDWVFLAILSDLADTHHVGEVKETLDWLYEEKGEEIEKRKRVLLERYVTEHEGK